MEISAHELDLSQQPRCCAGRVFPIYKVIGPELICVSPGRPCRPPPCGRATHTQNKNKNKRCVGHASFASFPISTVSIRIVRRRDRMGSDRIRPQGPRSSRYTRGALLLRAKKNPKRTEKNRRPANLGAILERPRKLGKTEMRKQSGLSVRANIKLKVGVPKLWARRWRREKHKRKLGKSNKKNSVKNVVGRRHAARKTDVVCVGNERKLGTKEQHKLVSP